MFDVSSLAPEMLALGAFAGLVCGFLNTVASSGSAVSLPILMMMGLDPIAANATNRLGVLVGAMTATGTFQRANQIPWRMALRVLPSVTLGSAVGALLAEYIPARDLGIAITAAVLVAFVLLFTKVKAAIESAASAPVHFGIREDTIFFGIGVWLGFIVLDGATYLLLALVLAVHLPLLQANAIKSLALVPSSVMALIMFALDGAVVWSVGAVMAAGSIVGGMLGARVAGSASTMDRRRHLASLSPRRLPPTSASAVSWPRRFPPAARRAASSLSAGEFSGSTKAAARSATS